MRLATFVTVLLLVMVTMGIASAAIVTLPNTANTVTFTATVAEQCEVTTIPSAIGFTVDDHTAATNSAAQDVTISNIVLNDGKKLKISIQANAADFTPPTGAGTQWAASDVSWNAATWTNGTGAASSGGLSNAAYKEVVTSSANAATLTTTGSLVFTLASKDTIDRAGAYTLVATWKVEGNI